MVLSGLCGDPGRVVLQEVESLWLLYTQTREIVQVSRLHCAELLWSVSDGIAGRR